MIRYALALVLPTRVGMVRGGEDLLMRDPVLPTRVGMVRGGAARGSRGRCSPHPRGDGPELGDKLKAER